MMTPMSVMPGVDQVVDDVEEDRAIGHRYELLGAGVRERAQARARAAGEDEALHEAPFSRPRRSRA